MVYMCAAITRSGRQGVIKSSFETRASATLIASHALARKVFEGLKLPGAFNGLAACCPEVSLIIGNGRRRADIEPSRPITVLSVLYRWWSRVTRCHMWLFACSQCTQASVRDRIGLKGIGFTESFPNGPTFQPFSS